MGLGGTRVRLKHLAPLEIVAGVRRRPRKPSTIQYVMQRNRNTLQGRELRCRAPITLWKAVVAPQWRVARWRILRPAESTGGSQHAEGRKSSPHQAAGCLSDRPSEPSESARSSFAPRSRLFLFGCGSLFPIRYVSGGLLFLKPLGTFLTMQPDALFGQ